MEQTLDNTKRLAKNTLMLYARMLLIMLVTLYTSRIVLAELGETDYGIYNVIGGVVVLFSFINGAMAQSTQRYLSFDIGKGDGNHLKKTFKTALSIHILIGVIVFTLAETIGLWFINTVMNIPIEQKSAANWVFQCSVIAYVISIFQVPFNAAIIAREKMQAFAYIGVGEAVLKLLIAFSLTFFLIDKLKIYALLVLSVTLLISLVYILYATLNFKECVLGWLYEQELFISMSKYAVWNTFGSMAWIGKTQGCNIILNIFYGPVINASYGISSQVNAAINSFVQNFTTAINPQIVKSYSKGNYQEMNRLIIYGSKFSFLLMIVLTFPILTSTQTILSKWLIEVPPYAGIFTQLVIINSVIESFSYCMGTGIQATGKIKWYQIIVGTSIILNIPISFLCLRYGCNPPVIFVVSISISLVAFLERLVIMKRELPIFNVMKFIRFAVIPDILLGLTCLILGFVIVRSRLEILIGFIPCLFVSFIAAFFLVSIIGLNSKERFFIYQYIKKKI